MPQVAARFKMEGKPHRALNFVCSSETREEQVEEIRQMIKGEFGCDLVDIEVTEIGGHPGALSKAPAPAKRFPTKSEMDDMKKANLVTLASELGIDGDFDKIRKDALVDLIAEKIEEIQTAPAK